MRHFQAAASLLALSLPTLAYAAEEYVPKEVKTTEKGKRADGFVPKLGVGLTFSFTSNNNVVGQDEGLALSLGLAIASQLDYNAGAHESRTVITLAETVSRTPAIDRFIKSADAFALESLYYYHAIEWFGPFFKFNLDTTIFPSYNEQARDVTYNVTFEGDAPEDCGMNVVGTACSVMRNSFKTGGFFQPLTLKESIGAFAVAVESKPARLDFRLGLGARETIADGAFSTKKESDVLYTLTEIGTFAQVGAEVSVAVNGASDDDRIIYRGTIDVMMPFAPSSDERSLIENTNIEAAFRLGVKLVDWASLAYEAKFIRVPAILDKLQVQNNLLLSITYDIIKPEVAPAPEAGK